MIEFIVTKDKQTIKNKCSLEDTILILKQKIIQELLNDTISTLGENIEIKRFSRFQLGESIKKQEDSK